MVLRWLLGISEEDEDSNELEAHEDADSLPWWEKVSHPDPVVRTQGHREEQQEREANVRYERD